MVSNATVEIGRSWEFPSIANLQDVSCMCNSNCMMCRVGQTTDECFEKLESWAVRLQLARCGRNAVPRAPPGTAYMVIFYSCEVFCTNMVHFDVWSPDSVHTHVPCAEAEITRPRNTDVTLLVMAALQYGPSTGRHSNLQQVLKRELDRQLLFSVRNN